MARQTAISALSKERMWHTFMVAALVIAGLTLTGIVTWLNIRSSHRLWEQAAVARAEQISESLRYRVMRNREPLIAISTLYSGSDDVTLTELETAREQILAVTRLDVEHLVAFITPAAGSSAEPRYQWNQVAGNLPALKASPGKPLDSRLQTAADAAWQRPGQLLLGAMVRIEDISYLPIVITSYNADQQGVLLYLLDFSHLLRLMMTTVLGPDITFNLYHPETGDINHASLPPLATSAEAEHNVSIDMGLYSWRLDWAFDADAGAGIDQRLSYVIALGGTLTALLTGFLLLNLINQRHIVQQQVKRKTRELEEAQVMLVKREKMAALGKMVAGISHELNTPIGNSLLAATLLRNRSREMADELLDNNSQLNEFDRKEILDNFVSVASESTRMIEKNIQRATELIRSFKHVAVDQTSERRRDFNLAETLQELAQTLAPGLREENLELTLDVPTDIHMDSFPGALYQVVSNLVTNATIHAYPAEQFPHGSRTRCRGELLLEVSRLDRDKILLSFSDDGAGIADEVRNHIFEPFFTTRMGSGGSGLGLHIVYTLITDVLGGQIQLATTERGTRFLISLPLTAP